MPVNNSEITKEMLEKAMQCETAEELMEFTKSKGIAITKDEAEAYLAELSDYELKNGELKDVQADPCKALPYIEIQLISAIWFLFAVKTCRVCPI